MMQAAQIREIMSRPATIAKSASITEALDRMLEQGADPLIVTHNGAVVGTVSRKAIADILGSRRNSSISPNSLHVSSSMESDFTVAYGNQEIDILIPLLQRYKLVVVLDEEHRLLGQVTAGDLLKAIEPEAELEEMLEPAYTIQSEERVVHLRRRMIDERINRFIVMENDRMVGIVTETDVAKAMRSFRELVEDKHQDHRIRNLLVRDIMSSPVLTVEKGTPVRDVIELMLKKNISGIPVSEAGEIIGFVTKDSLVKAL
ncbi:MAG: CBS domain-containing protein [Methanomicrobiales archaeon]|nr:CBS domain-containing protein [Methanomicrobiales archaeon]